MRSSSACSTVPLCVASGVTDGTTTIDSPGWLSRMRLPERDEPLLEPGEALRCARAR